MGTPSLPLGHLEAGRAYLDAVERLGLRPLGLLWAFDRVIDHFALVLIAEEYEQAGPLELSRVLFKAYNAEATPRAIDPFIVRLHSPHQPIVIELGKFLPMKLELKPMTPLPAGQPEPFSDKAAMVNAGGLEIDSRWVYRFNTSTRRTDTVEALRRWRCFSANVDKLAA